MSISCLLFRHFLLGLSKSNLNEREAFSNEMDKGTRASNLHKGL